MTKLKRTGSSPSHWTRIWRRIERRGQDESSLSFYYKEPFHLVCLSKPFCLLPCSTIGSPFFSHRHGLSLQIYPSVHLFLFSDSLPFFTSLLTILIAAFFSVHFLFTRYPDLSIVSFDYPTESDRDGRDMNFQPNDILNCESRIIQGAGDVSNERERVRA